MCRQVYYPINEKYSILYKNHLHYQNHYLVAYTLFWHISYNYRLLLHRVLIYIATFFFHSLRGIVIVSYLLTNDITLYPKSLFNQNGKCECVCVLKPGIGKKNIYTSGKSFLFFYVFRTKIFCLLISTLKQQRWLEINII